LRYEPDPLGAIAAREAVCRSLTDLCVGIGPEQILVTASTSEAYGYLFKLLCDPGDQLLIPTPSYPLFNHLARFEGIEAVPYPLGFDGSFHLDLSRILPLVGPRTRAIVVVNPNNPTGHFIKTEELDALERLGLPVISDEVFNGYVLDAPRTAVRTLLGRSELLVFALSGLSKLAGLPQLKVGWIVVQGPLALAREALERLELIADTFLSPSAPALLALPELLEYSGAIRAQIGERVARNARALTSRLERSAATALPIEGGWYAVVRLPRTQPEEDWVGSLLEERGVLVQPGYFFDFEDEPYAVLSLLTPPARFDAGMVALAEHVAERTR
jgi:aspartate/methionine/tyrosine aminotransferase